MTGPDPAVALTRRAVRHVLRSVVAEAGRPGSRAGTPPVVVGVSGGADSLALAAAVAFEAPRIDVPVEVVVVDHGLQDGSATVARSAAEICRETLGLSTRVCAVTVADDGSGPEAGARTARYRALQEVASQVGAGGVLVGHTGDDQAEQVLLGMLRGSGTRSLSGMAVRNGEVFRPFLFGPPILPDGPVLRVNTAAACRAQGLTPWQDPHNVDARFARVRAREALRLLEERFPGSALRRSLIRTADSARRDADLLDRLTDDALTRASGTADPDAWPTAWPVEALTALDPALRVRALRRLLLAAGAPGAELTSQHLLEVEGLLVRWHGQGPIDIPGHLEVVRHRGEVAIRGRGGPQ